MGACHNMVGGGSGGAKQMQQGVVQSGNMQYASISVTFDNKPDVVGFSAISDTSYIVGYFDANGTKHILASGGASISVTYLPNQKNLQATASWNGFSVMTLVYFIQ